MLKRIHVNRHIIAKNKREGSREAPLSVVDYKKNIKGHKVQIYGQAGDLAAVIVYSPDKPLKCGATVWIETNGLVFTLDEHGVVLS